MILQDPLRTADRITLAVQQVANAPQQININDDFSLPALGPNEFDDFLNDMSFDETINLNNDGMMNMENMESMENVDNMDLDFDSMFG